MGTEPSRASAATGPGRVEFSITGSSGQALHEPAFVDDCAELPIAIMRVMEDDLDTHGGRLDLPLTIEIGHSPGSPTC